MTTNEATDQQIDHDVLSAAAAQLATALGVTAEPMRGETWPIDVGQTSLCADFEGTTSGTLYLSLGEAVAEAVTADHESVVGQLLGAMGVDVTDLDVSPFRAADDLPFLHVVVRDDAQIVGFGVSMNGGGDADASTGGGAAGDGAAAYEPTPIADAVQAGASMGAPITLLADVDMDVTVELGRANVPVRELLSLQPGMVIELDRQAGSPIDVLVNGRLIARGEVVVLDEQFGLRITEIVTAKSGGR